MQEEAAETPELGVAQAKRHVIEVVLVHAPFEAMHAEPPQLFEVDLVEELPQFRRLVDRVRKAQVPGHRGDLGALFLDAVQAGIGEKVEHRIVAGQRDVLQRIAGYEIERAALLFPEPIDGIEVTVLRGKRKGHSHFPQD